MNLIEIDENQSTQFDQNNLKKSPIKWAGGKSKLLSLIIPELIGNTLLEPFCGSGVVSLNCNQTNIIMNDFNKDLVFLFESIKNNHKILLEQLDELFLVGNEKEKYLEFRKSFNLETDKLKRASLFVYLNRHCFNGLCRYNSSGGFNVPFGKYDKLNIPKNEINICHKILNDKDVKFFNLDFLEIMDMSNSGDVVYCDPPYIPITETSFVNYSGSGFTLEQHQKLAEKAYELSQKNVKVVISNHDVELVRELYKKSKRIIEVDVRRSISNNSDSRGKVKEIIAIF